MSFATRDVYDDDVVHPVAVDHFYPPHGHHAHIGNVTHHEDDDDMGLDAPIAAHGSHHGSRHDSHHGSRHDSHHGSRHDSHSDALTLSQDTISALLKDGEMKIAVDAAGVVQVNDQPISVNGQSLRVQGLENIAPLGCHATRRAPIKLNTNIPPDVDIGSPCVILSMNPNCGSCHHLYDVIAKDKDIQGGRVYAYDTSSPERTAAFNKLIQTIIQRNQETKRNVMHPGMNFSGWPRAYMVGADGSLRLFEGAPEEFKRFYNMCMQTKCG